MPRIRLHVIYVQEWYAGYICSLFHFTGFPTSFTDSKSWMWQQHLFVLNQILRLNSLSRPLLLRVGARTFAIIRAWMKEQLLLNEFRDNVKAVKIDFARPALPQMYSYEQDNHSL